MAGPLPCSTPFGATRGLHQRAHSSWLSSAPTCGSAHPPPVFRRGAPHPGHRDKSRPSPRAAGPCTAGGDSSRAVLTGAGGAPRVSQRRARGVPGAGKAWRCVPERGQGARRPQGGAARVHRGSAAAFPGWCLPKASAPSPGTIKTGSERRGRGHSAAPQHRGANGVVLLQGAPLAAPLPPCPQSP